MAETLVEVLEGRLGCAWSFTSPIRISSTTKWFKRVAMDEHAIEIIDNAIMSPPDGEDLDELYDHLVGLFDDAIKAIDGRVRMYVLHPPKGNPGDYEIVFAFRTLRDLTFFQLHRK